MPSNEATRAQTAASGAAASEVAETSRGPVEFARVGGPPYILFFHGSPGGYDQGVSNDDFAGAGFGTIAVSRPGYLRTPLSTGPRMEEQADAMAALLDVLEVDRVVAYGVSGGGPSAIQFAARHPDRTSALLLGCAITQRYVSSTLPGWAMRVLLSDPFIRLQDWAMARFPRAGIEASPELVTRAPFYLKSGRRRGSGFRRPACGSPYTHPARQPRERPGAPSAGDAVLLNHVPALCRAELQHVPECSRNAKGRNRLALPEHRSLAKARIAWRAFLGVSPPKDSLRSAPWVDGFVAAVQAVGSARVEQDARSVGKWLRPLHPPEWRSRLTGISYSPATFPGGRGPSKAW